MRMRPFMIALLTCCMGLMTASTQAQTDTVVDTGYIDLYDSLGFNQPCAGATQPTNCDANGVTTMNAGTCYIYVCKSQTSQCPTYSECEVGETRTDSTDANGCPKVTCTKPAVCQTIDQVTCPTGQMAVDSGNKDDATCPIFSCQIDPNAVPDGVCRNPSANGDCPMCDEAATCPAGQKQVKGAIKNGCQLLACEPCTTTNADGTCADDMCPVPVKCAADEMAVSTGKDANDCETTVCQKKVCPQIAACPPGLTGTVTTDQYGCKKLSCGKTIFGTADNDEIYSGKGDDKVWGRDGQDKLFGGEGVNTIGGGAGNDIVGTGQGVGGTGYGGAGNDTLYGGGGGKTLYGGAGNDTLYSGATASTMYGGEGNDTFFVKAAGSTIVTGTGNNSVYLGNMSTGSVSVNGVSVEKTSSGSLLVGGTAMTPDTKGMVKMTDGTIIWATKSQ